GTLYGIRGQVNLGITLSGIRQYLGLVISKLRTYIIPMARIIGILLAIMWFIALLLGPEFMIGKYSGWLLVGITIMGVCICKPINRMLLMVLLLLIFCLLDLELRLVTIQLLDNDVLTGINWRFYLLAPFGAIISGAYGLNLALQSKLSRINNANKWKEISGKAIMCIVAVCVLFSFSISLKIDHYRARDQGENYAMLYENDQLQSLASGESAEPFRVATVPFYSKSYQLFPSQANAYGLESVDGFLVWYPLRYKQYWAEVIRPALSIDDPRYHSFYQKFNSWGHQVYLFSPPYWESSKLDEIPFSNYNNLNLLALANTKYIISAFPLSDANLSLLPSHNDFENSDPLYIYENKICLPRSFVCGSVTIYDNEDDLLKAMSADEIETLRESAYITKEFAQDINAERLNITQSEVKIEAYSPDRIVLSTKTDGRGILVITNNYSPYWSCSVNGIEKNIIPVYHTFMGVMIEEGNNRIEIEYDPPYWTFW
ncbi:YfhO family protein, partial [bacterium]|nr:YfhO family protein [bacterium]